MEDGDLEQAAAASTEAELDIASLPKSPRESVKDSVPPEPPLSVPGQPFSAYHLVQRRMLENFLASVQCCLPFLPFILGIVICSVPVKCSELWQHKHEMQKPTKALKQNSCLSFLYFQP